MQTHVHTHTRTHTLSLSLPPSLKHIHTHVYTQVALKGKIERRHQDLERAEKRFKSLKKVCVLCGCGCVWRAKSAGSRAVEERLCVLYVHLCACACMFVRTRVVSVCQPIYYYFFFLFLQHLLPSFCVSFPLEMYLHSITPEYSNLN
jgi:hypothetical protein